MKAILAILFLVLGSEASVAQPDIWKASSDNAAAVTGDIRIEQDSIVFANGTGLRLVPIEERMGVFKVDPPANPKLIDGKRLCGDKELTYVTLAQGSDRSLFMKVFDQPSAPTEAFGNQLAQDGACGIYRFSE
jgi:hypothetical protein